MKNKEQWIPSKFIFKKGILKGSRNIKDVSISSRLISDLIAKFYDVSIKKYANGHLLDLGCGKVPLYHVYEKYIIDNICIDWENSFHQNKHLDFSADLNEKLPILDKSFDTIILSDVLEHIRDPNLLWKEMSRSLRKDGILLMNVPFYYWLHEEPFDYFRYTKHALQYMAKSNNFEILELEVIGGVPEILTDIFAKTIIQIPYIGKTIAIFIQYVTHSFINTKIGEKISRKTSHQFPLGYTLVAKRL